MLLSIYMKKELIISSIITIVLIALVVFTNKQSLSNTSKITPKTSTSTSTAFTGITRSEVAKHNVASDCWIIINKNAYNVTAYLSKHPGGSAEVIKTCGTDATVAYDAIKGGRGHSSSADSDLSSLLIGAVQ